MKTLVLITLSLFVLCSCTTMKMWRENDNLITNTLMTPVKLVEDALTLGGTTTPAEGARFWMEAFQVIDGRSFPTQMQSRSRTWQINGPHYQRQRQNDFNHLLRTYPTASGR